MISAVIQTLRQWNRHSKSLEKHNVARPERSSGLPGRQRMSGIWGAAGVGASLVFRMHWIYMELV